VTNVRAAVVALAILWTTLALADESASVKVSGGWAGHRDEGIKLAFGLGGIGMEILPSGFAAVRDEVAAARAADTAGEDGATPDAASASRVEETVTAFLSPAGSTPWGDATRP
jgi:hypothetical protein